VRRRMNSSIQVRLAARTTPTPREIKRLRLHLRLTFPVAATAFRRKLTCVRPRPLDGLELAGSPKPGELALVNGIEIPAFLQCGPNSTFPPHIIYIAVLQMIGCVAAFRTVGPDGVLLRNGAGPCFAKIWV